MTRAEIEEMLATMAKVQRSLRESSHRMRQAATHMATVAMHLQEMGEHTDAAIRAALPHLTEEKEDTANG